MAVSSGPLPLTVLPASLGRMESVEQESLNSIEEAAHWYFVARHLPPLRRFDNNLTNTFYSGVALLAITSLLAEVYFSPIGAFRDLGIALLCGAVGSALLYHVFRHFWECHKFVRGLRQHQLPYAQRARGS